MAYDAGSAAMSDEPAGSDNISATITSGSISGQIVVGKGNSVSSVSVGAGSPVTREEQAALDQHFAQLRLAVAQGAPPERRDAALERVDELQEAVLAEKPDVATIEYVRNWFGRHLPSVAGAVTSVVFNPIVGKLVAAAGDAIVGEFRRRLGGTPADE